MRTRTYQTFEGPKQAHKVGNCIICDSPLYVFENGSSGDPRGAIKEHNNYDPFIASEYSMQGPDVPACFTCQNDAFSYHHGLDIAKTKWTEVMP